MPTAAVWLPLHVPDCPLMLAAVKAPLLMVSVIVICSPCVPAGIWIGVLKTHDRLPSVNPLMPTSLLDGLLTISVRVAIVPE